MLSFNRVQPRLCRCPSLRKNFCLLEHRLRCFLLHIRRIAVFAKDPFYEHTQLCSNIVANRPINCDVCSNGGDEFAGYGAQDIIAHYFDCTFAGLQGIIKGDLVFAYSPNTARVLASVFSIGVPVKPMKEARGNASRM